MEYSRYTEARRERIERLQTDADSLFSIRQVRESCQAISPSDSESIEYRFAHSLITSFGSVKTEIMEWGKGCLPEYLLQEAHKEREGTIEAFAVMRMASRWYQMRDDDVVWRTFALNIPFGEEDQEENIGLFFYRLNKICILTDILTGDAAEYGFDIDYTKQVPIPKLNQNDDKCKVPEGELFKFIRPELTDEEEQKIHKAVKKLVTRQGIQEICKYLNLLESKEMTFLPQSAETAYKELVRMGMPDGEGFNIKTFMKYYKK